MQDTLAAMIEYSQWADERLIVASSALTDDQYCRRLAGGFGSVQATSLISRALRTRGLC